MKKNPAILMASLTFTAVVLAVILLAAPQRSAIGDMINIQSGLTLLTTGGIGGVDEFVVIMDKSSDKILIYRMNVNNGLELVAGGDYQKLFGSAAPAGAPGAPAAPAGRTGSY